ncbi:MAG: hypothetical protein JNM94_10170 [Phycisphaerae bacterium]|nr:hypothetical protein [Phycisphaerae bacterium]
MPHDERNAWNDEPARRRTTSLTHVGACLIAAVLAAPAALAQTTPSVGVFTVRVNGGAVHSIQCFAEPGPEATSVVFKGGSSDSGGAWDVSWQYTADLDPNGGAKVTGAATVVNKSSAKLDYELSFEVPLCPHISSGAKMGGTCTLKLVTNENGGVLSTAPGNAIFNAMSDGMVGPKVFHGPFNMGSTGSGTAQTMNAFGAPFPGHNVGSVNEDFGMRHLFSLTDGDSVIVTTNLVVGGDPSNFVSCPDVKAADSDVDAPSAPPPAAPPQPAAPPAGGDSEPAAPPPAFAPALPGEPSISTVVFGDDAPKKVTLSAGPAKGAKSIKKAPAPKKSSAAATKKPATKKAPVKSGSSNASRRR